MNKGYYIKARQISGSWVAHSAPIVREVWDYLLREANHRDKKYMGFMVNRGQLFRSYKDIREDLKWRVGYRFQRYHESSMKRAMNALRKEGMIELATEPRGNIITVLNYDKYQDPSYYDRANDRANDRTSSEPVANQYRSAINKNEKNVRMEEGYGEKISPSPSKIAQEFFEDCQTEGPQYQKVIESLNEKGVAPTAATEQIKRFFNYWTEKNKSGTKQRWQMEKTFEVGRRLATWFSNVRNFSPTPIWKQEQEQELASMRGKYFGK